MKLQQRKGRKFGKKKIDKILVLCFDAKRLKMSLLKFYDHFKRDTF